MRKNIFFAQKNIVISLILLCFLLYLFSIRYYCWGRLVTLEHFYKAYSTIIDTMVAMEWLEFVDRVEIYCRGEGNSSPVKIYGTNDNANVFPDVRAALIGGRKQDRIKAIEKFQSFNSIIRQLLGNRHLTEEEKKCFKANTTII